jgi:hypothetical protein
MTERPGTTERPHWYPPFLDAARFDSDRPALVAYTSIRTALYRSACELSTYRLLIDQFPHVVVLGDLPANDLVASIHEALRDGIPASLHPETVWALVTRRNTAARLGPWVERHQEP